MGLAQNPRTVTDGLVFYYDQANVKSYIGPAIQNLASTISFNNATGTGISIVGGNEIVNVPQIGPTNVTFSTIQNNYLSFSPNSADCCPNPFRYTGTWGSGFTVSPSTLYTYAIVYKVNSGYTHPNYMYRYEYASNGGAYVTEAGVHSDSNRIHLGDGWYWAWGTFTTTSTTNWIQYAGAWYYRYSNKPDKLSIAKVLITPGNYTSVHPIYWPDVNTTRSATQPIRDMTSTATITANSMSYASNGAVSFNGTSSFISIPNSSALQVADTFTINTWINATSLIARHGLFSTRTANDAGSWQLEVGIANSGTGRIAFTGVGTWIWESSNNVIATNTWYNICLVKTNNSELGASVYLNGTLLTPGVTTAYTILNNSNTKVIGQGTSGLQPFSGTINSTSLYNRALTAAEVQHNFNAFRGRYGI